MNLELQAQKRELLGTKKVTTLRKEGFLPVELYGNGKENVHLSLKVDDFEKVYEEGGENTVIQLKFDKEQRPVMVHYVQLDPLSGKMLAVDLYEVDMAKKITANVPIEFVGESPAVVEHSGVLNKAIDEIEVEALPTDIPHEITIDISVLDNFEKSIHVRDIVVSGNFVILTDPETTVANVSEPRVEEVEPVAEMSIEDIEVLGEKKKKDEDEEAGGEESSNGADS